MECNFWSMSYLNNSNLDCMCFNQTAISFGTWKSNVISHLCMNVIHHPCPQHHDCLTHCCLVMPYTSRSTLTQVIAWCLMAPSHYLNKCGLMVTGVLWHSPEINFIRIAHELNSQYVLQDQTTLLPWHPGANELRQQDLRCNWCSIRRLPSYTPHPNNPGWAMQMAGFMDHTEQMVWILAAPTHNIKLQLHKIHNNITIFEHTIYHIKFG